MSSSTSIDNSLTKIMSLLQDPDFVAFELSQESPTIFNAVGRTHTETWHSALLGWLIDSQSSHGLVNFPIERLLLLLQTQDEIDRVQREVRFYDIIALADFSNVRVRPNERELSEVSVQAVGRFDVYIDGIRLPDDKEVHILIEVKVNSAIDIKQCKRYMNYLDTKKKENIYVIPVFVAPESALIGTSLQLFGDERWVGVSFQDIYDDIIEVCLRHPQISPFGHSTLNEYVKTLKYKQKGDHSMAITQQDRELVRVLFEKHEPAIRAFYEILSQRYEEFEPLSTNGSGAKAEVKVRLNNKEFTAPSISKLYREVLKYLVDHGYLNNLELPIASGSKRYLIAKEPTHQQGNSFVNSVGYKDFYMEANKSRDTGLSDLAKMAHLCKLTFEVSGVNTFTL